MDNMETVLAVYDNFETANKAIRDLAGAGFSRSEIGLAANDARGEYAHVAEATDEDVSGSEGASFGAAVGGVTGAVASLSAIVIPGIGPIIAAGPLVALLGGVAGAVVGATAGAVAGGLTASLVHIGVPEDEAGHYAESVRRGNALVTVTTRNDDEVTKAMNILRMYHPIDVEHQASDWRAKGWTGFDANAEPYTDEDLVREGELYRKEKRSDNSDDTVRRYPPVPPVR